MLIGYLFLCVSSNMEIIQSAQHPPPAPTAVFLQSLHGMDLSKLGEPMSIRLYL